MKRYLSGFDAATLAFGLTKEERVGGSSPEGLRLFRRIDRPAPEGENGATAAQKNSKRVRQIVKVVRTRLPV